MRPLAIRSFRLEGRSAGRLLLLFLALVAPLHATEPVQDDLHGVPLSAALRALQQEGLRLVFSNGIVEPEMWVVEVPRAGDPRQRAETMLAAHGLGVELGPGGVLLVVRKVAAPDSIVGRLVAAGTGRPVPGARLRIEGLETPLKSDAKGRFHARVDLDTSGRPPRIEVIHPDFLPLDIDLAELGDRREHRMEIELTPRRIVGEVIDVVPNPRPYVGTEISSIAISATERDAIPQISNEALRPLTTLPGTTGSDVSARFGIRGGRTDEVLVVLDGFEVFDPYHLPDFDDALSLFAPGTVAEIQLRTGGFSPEYGDRMGGVLELVTVQPAERRQIDIGISALEAHTSGSIRTERGIGLFASLRHGLLPVPLRKRNAPTFWDALAKVSSDPETDRSWHMSALLARDDLEFDEALEIGDGRVDGRETLDTRYRQAHFGLSQDRLVGGRHLLRSQFSWSGLDRLRAGERSETLSSYQLLDERQTEIATLGASWSALVLPDHELRTGFEIRRAETHYDYDRTSDFAPLLSDLPSGRAPTALRTDLRLRSLHTSAYAVDRWRPHLDWTIEVGLRLDEKTLPEDNHQISPRLGIDWKVGPRSRMSLAWGLFHQSQRVYELDVPDGRQELDRAERGEHLAVGYERAFAARNGSGVLRVELYQREAERTRRRFENLLDPFSFAGEAEWDRAEIEPQSSRARGLELFATGRRSLKPGSGDLTWFVGYDLAIAEDRIDGLNVPRENDRRHTFRANFGLPAPLGWRIDVHGEIRSGQPTTPILTTASGTIDFGPLRSERLPTYARLDLRADRVFATRHGDFEVFFAVRNVAGRRNRRGDSLEPGDSIVSPWSTQPEHWPGAVPNAGIRWRF